ncbi:hypothetical protein FGG08_005502 [Glutinoglossum americanum]|uniref:Uncharacterized protein n=1 Tax=Glutinoglossum americanum TaxID=1670608 RepID=A0A9P8HUE0_9PEZI|nr:hypothetical protein FGG08_005502 [Glutinoglossum americanum]
MPRTPCSSEDQPEGAYVRTLAKVLDNLSSLKSLTIDAGRSPAPGVNVITDITLVHPRTATYARERGAFATVIEALTQLSKPLPESAIAEGNFDKLQSGLENLMTFLIRHAATLNALHLKDIRLVGRPAGGLWVDAFKYFRTKLQLKHAKFNRSLRDRDL